LKRSFREIEQLGEADFEARVRIVALLKCDATKLVTRYSYAEELQ